MENHKAAFDKKNLSKKDLEDFYNQPERYNWSFNTIHGFTNPSDQRRLKVILEEIKKRNPKKILDVGCGGGVFIRALAKENYEVTGTDIAENLLKKIPKDKLHFTLKKADAEKLPFKNDTFDCVICSEVIEHLLHPKMAIEEIGRVLKPSGFALLTLPNLHCYESLEYRFRLISKTVGFLNKFRRKKLYPFGWTTHVNQYTPQKWQEVISGHGLSIIEDKAVFISPYIFEFLKPLKRIEIYFYSLSPIYNFQFWLENRVSRLSPFKYLGQHHLFICTKLA